VEARERHGHDVTVAALLAPFADTVSAPVAADLRLREDTGGAGAKALVSGWGIGGRGGGRAGRGVGRSRLLNFCGFGLGL
jgi:hypothetical protein